jgi:hypothetical protein
MNELIKKLKAHDISENIIDKISAVKKDNKPFQIHNCFKLELYDKDGNLKQTAEAYNMVMNYFWQNLASSQKFSYFQIGTGTGIIVPTRTSLFNYLGYVTTSKQSEEYDFPVSTLVLSGTFPATTAFQGVITEIGISSSSNASLRTHALLQDSEGNPISINKLSTDILIVTATVFVNVQYSNIFRLVSDINLGSYSNNFIKYLFELGGTGGSYFREIFKRPTLYVINRPENGYVEMAMIGGINSYSWDTTNGARFTNAQNRLVQGSGNYGYANALILGRFFCVDFPNYDIFPPFMLSPMEVGRGDGITSEFACPIPHFIPNSEEVKIGNTVLTRDIDYTIDPLGNTACDWSVKHSALSNYFKEIETNNQTSIISSWFSYPALVGEVLGTSNLITGRNTVWEFDAPVTCNAMFVENVRTSSGTVVITDCWLQASDDKINWDNVAQIPDGTYTTTGTNMPNNGLFRFTPRTAKYWRFSYNSSSGTVNVIFPQGKQSFFGYVGDGIHFNAPPQNGALITISAQVDRPYKTSDYVMDMSAVVSLADPPV